MSERRNRNWCFTINNFDEEDEARVCSLESNENVFRLIAEHEHVDSGTPHIQGYISFHEPIYRVNVERLLGGRAWLQAARGGWKQNVAYCSKEGLIIACKNINPDEEVDESKSITTHILDDAKVLDPWAFEDKYPLIWFKHRQQILNTMMDAALRRVENWDGDLKGKNYWIWGKAGVGKSRWASSQINIHKQYKKAVNKWWDGYNLVTHRMVILEDFPVTGNMFAQHIKIWSDRYFFMAECKGSSLVVEPGRFFFIITSNFPIAACFENEEDIEAIRRRFSEIEFTEANIALFSQLSLDENLLKS